MNKKSLILFMRRKVWSSQVKNTVNKIKEVQFPPATMIIKSSILMKRRKL